MDSIELRGYQYELFASRLANVLAHMRLYAEHGVVGHVEFLADGEPLPPAERPPSGQHRLYYPFSSLPMVVDLLRNEKPIFLVWAGAAGSRLSTSPEPVGEGEER